VTACRSRRAALVLGVCALAALPAQAQFKGLRAPSEAEQRTLMTALLANPQMAMSEDPSCKADLSQPGTVSVTNALGEALARAAASRPPRVVRVDCFQREGYPMAQGQEFCRVAFLPAGRPKDSGFGLLFLMDWPRKAVVTSSAECF
jgi:hypothetical protein